MRHASILAGLLISAALLAGQGTGILRITVTLPGDMDHATPLARHALLISATPVSAAPRRVLTSRDGSVEVRLRPGSYAVESDQPVSVGGRRYTWTQTVNVTAGGTVTLALTAGNAEVEAFAGVEGPAASADGPSFVFRRWENSVAAVWSPTSRATGFLVDARGLVLTHDAAVRSTSPASVQFSADVKVPAAVVLADPTRGLAVLRVHPSAVAGLVPVPLSCSTPATFAEGQEFMTISAPLWRPKDVAWGGVTGFAPRAIDTDLRLSFGGTGGPAFDAAGRVAGITAPRQGVGGNGRDDVAIVRAGIACELLAGIDERLATVPAPAPERLPVEPDRRFPADALERAGKDTGPEPPSAVADDFEVTFITPPAIQRGRAKADWTGGRATRAPEMEARLGRITDFGEWSTYFADLPPVLAVRVSPTLDEGFWKRLAREAARTQGAVLPPLVGFRSSFLRLDATCGATRVTPIQPLVIEHRFDTRTVREGLYVFDASAFGPHCGTTTITIYSERSPEKGEAVRIDPKMVAAAWDDFAAYRAAR